MDLSRIKFHLGLAYAAWHPRYALAHGLAHLVPRFGSGALIAGFYRMGGMSIGHGAAFGGPLTIRGGEPTGDQLQIGKNVVLATDITINLDGAVTLGDTCSIGPFVRIYTGTHGIGPGSRRMLPAVSPRPVKIGKGAWLGLGTIVLPGVEVGDGSVIGAGSVVTDDIPPHTYAAGNPAIVVRSLPWSDR